MLQSHSGWSKFVGQPLITPIIFVVYKMIEVLQKFRISSKLSSRVLYKIIIVYIVRLYIFYIIFLINGLLTIPFILFIQRRIKSEMIRWLAKMNIFEKEKKKIKRRTKHSMNAKSNLENCKHK